MSHIFPTKFPTRVLSFFRARAPMHARHVVAAVGFHGDATGRPYWKRAKKPRDEKERENYRAQKRRQRCPEEHRANVFIRDGVFHGKSKMRTGRYGGGTEGGGNEKERERTHTWPGKGKKRIVPTKPHIERDCANARRRRYSHLAGSFPVPLCYC